ncbi:MAG: 5,6-dimethylbenzimidazole synthase, partial [Pirellulales bacterium]|nr:5,6-dimethylbenzimidazole synthase [Pirellulales bacterium]
MIQANVGLAEAEHGGLDRAGLLARGIDPESILDLSSNLLFVDQPDSVRRAICTADVSGYPDRDCGELREALADRHEIPCERILVGNGCSELIHLVASNWLQPGHRCLVVGPTFSEYARASRLLGATVDQVSAGPEDGFAVPVDEVTSALEQSNYDLVWICNPNNPTGRGIKDAVIHRWSQDHPETLFAVDESYIEFAQSVRSVGGGQAANLIVLRSMTKSYALAGLRLGYLIGQSAQIQALRDRRVPWSVNQLAQAAGVAALRAQPHYDAAIDRMRIQRKRLASELADRGWRPLASDTDFLLCEVGDADGVCDRLLGRGILVRHCRSFGLPNHVRIAIGDPLAGDRLLAALDPTQRWQAEHAAPPNSEPTPNPGPTWGAEFREQLYELFRMRRDVKRFRSDPIDPSSLARWMDAASMAPSVGLSQPWRFVSVNQPQIRARVAAEFDQQNELAARQYDEAVGDHYRQLKLAGLGEAPEQLAVFVDPQTSQGKGLGRRTMPETVAYSVVAAIQNFWLAARSEGVGVGWVSILRPERIGRLLSVPQHWQLIAYLCV